MLKKTLSVLVGVLLIVWATFPVYAQTVVYTDHFATDSVGNGFPDGWIMDNTGYWCTSDYCELSTQIHTGTSTGPERSMHIVRTARTGDGNDFTNKVVNLLPGTYSFTVWHKSTNTGWVEMSFWDLSLLDAADPYSPFNHWGWPRLTYVGAGSKADWFQFTSESFDVTAEYPGVFILTKQQFGTHDTGESFWEDLVITASTAGAGVIGVWKPIIKDAVNTDTDDDGLANEWVKDPFEAIPANVTVSMEADSKFGTVMQLSSDGTTGSLTVTRTFNLKAGRYAIRMWGNFPEGSKRSMTVTSIPYQGRTTGILAPPVPFMNDLSAYNGSWYEWMTPSFVVSTDGAGVQLAINIDKLLTTAKIGPVSIWSWDGSGNWVPVELSNFQAE